MSMRKDPLVSGEYYHIYNRSIAGFKIYNSARDITRFIDAMIYFRSPKTNLNFSRFLDLSEKNRQNIITGQDDLIVEIIAYCIMKTHFHIILRQNTDCGISKYLGDIQNSYSRYFNTKYKRRGPLWESKFKNVRVESDEQLFHLTRYIHLNPTSSGLVENPESWRWSSYHEYIKGKEDVCKYKEGVSISPQEYQEFVEDRKDYHKEISKMKALSIDNYSG